MKKPPPLPYAKSHQQDLAVDAMSCPCCGRPWDRRTAIKVCRKCGRVISPKEGWHMVPAGPGLIALEHKTCEVAPVKSPGPGCDWLGKSLDENLAIIAAWQEVAK